MENILALHQYIGVPFKAVKIDFSLFLFFGHLGGAEKTVKTTLTQWLTAFKDDMVNLLHN